MGGTTIFSLLVVREKRLASFRCDVAAGRCGCGVVGAESQRHKHGCSSELLKADWYWGVPVACCLREEAVVGLMFEPSL